MGKSGKNTSTSKTKKPKKELICKTHDKIKELATKISNYDLTALTIGEISEASEDISSMAIEIMDLADVALERGQAMEDRLFEYSNAVESLGFKRTKQKK